MILVRRRPRWFELVPEVVLVIGLAAFALDESDAASSAFKSGRAVALMAIGAVAWLVGRVLTWRFGSSESRAWPIVRTIGFCVAAAGVLAVVVVPAYDTETVTETSPIATAAPASAPASVPMPAEVTPAPAPIVRTGTLEGIDHRASGRVTLTAADAGRFVIGLEEFDIQPGPNYDLYVVPGEGKRSIEGGTRVDDLRGNRGTQYSHVDAGVIDLGQGPWTVLVWCQTFAVPVAGSTPV